MSAQPVRDAIFRRIGELLDEARAVVWYDPDGALAAVFEGLSREGLHKVDARRSALAARREADRAWATISAPDAPARDTTLLIYAPWRRATAEEAQVEEPFECFAQLGETFGDKPDHSLASLARKAMPGREGDIDELYAKQAHVTLAELEALAARAGFPLVRQAFETEDPAGVAALLLADPRSSRRHLGAAGVRREVERLLRESFGFVAPPSLDELRPALARWVLFSEFAFDVEGKVPAQTAHVGRAAAPFERAIYALCDRLRATEGWRDAYVELANEVEAALHLGAIAEDVFPWGKRDTFAAEDRAALRYVQARCLEGDLAEARRTLDLRRRSIWLHDPVRNQLWQLALRCLELLEACGAWDARVVPGARPVKEHVLAYQSPDDGLWRVDRAQRWMERAGGDCVEREVLQGLFEHARGAWRKAAESAQAAFVDAVAREGWPPDVTRQTQVFSKYVAPPLQGGEKTAYFLMDALRFEMGRDLAALLKRYGEVKVEVAASVVPATTTFGMAALLPGAEVDFQCVEREGELVPSVGGRAVANVSDRCGVFRERYGDRFVDVRLDHLLEAKASGLRQKLGRADFIVVRSDDIDRAGEGTNLPSARRFMSSILDDVSRVAARLAAAGVSRMVFCADHGHVLIPAVAPGDVVKAPSGEWPLRKRRCLVGKAGGSSEGVRVAPTRQFGMTGAPPDLAFATGFRVFTDGAAYFHEGVSMQECLVPVVTLVARPPTAADGALHVEVKYRHARFTQRVFIVHLRLATILHPTLDVRLVVCAPGAQRPAGGAADCDARDPATGLIRLRAGVDEAVAVRIDDDFEGEEVEVRVTDASGAGVVYGSKRLKNACLE